MKKLNLSMAAMFAFGTLAIAGGDIAPVEPVVETPIVAVDNTGFYAGLAYGYLNEDLTRTVNGAPGGRMDDAGFSTIMLQGGYQINQYVAAEARYWIGSGSKNTGATNFGTVNAPDAWGLYVKPMYPVTDKIDIYALLGYAHTDTNINKVSDFSWGIGASYELTDKIDLFVDYTSLYNGSLSATVAGNNVKKDYQIGTVDFGVSYKF